MPHQDDSDELTRALTSLKELGGEFRGPFVTSKGEIVVVEGTILMLSEVLELFSEGQLNRAGIRNLLSSQSKVRHNWAARGVYFTSHNYYWKSQ